MYLAKWQDLTGNSEMQWRLLPIAIVSASEKTQTN